MSSAINYSDVVSQLECAGLLLEGGLALGSAGAVRCRVDGESTKKGWYWLHEIPFDDGDIVIVGSFGVWQGSENNAQKVDLPKGRKTSKEDNILIRKRMVDNRKRMEAEVAEKHKKAAAQAVRKWRDYDADGESGYMTRKQVGAFGVRFTKDGALVVPVTDVKGRLHGLQFVLDKKNEAHKEKIKRMNGGDKRFWPRGLKISGNMHMIGSPSPSGVMVVTEGYATGASIHEATGVCVAVVFNVNNILPAIESIAKRFKRVSFLIAADDDYLCRCQGCKKQTLVENKACAHCGEAHGKQNAGVTIAMKAMVQVRNTQWVVPKFTARDGRKLTDFNDLHVEESLALVGSQIESAIVEKFPKLGQAFAGQASFSGGEAQQGGGESPVYSGLMNVDQACERYSLVYGFKDTLFDHQEHTLVPKSCVMDVIDDHAWREWKQIPARKVVRESAVGFDPTEKDKRIVCNLWGGWPTVPSKKGSCEKIKALLEYLCGGDRKVYQWVLNWIAFPIQNPGAKMKTALVFHGPQGTGKNLFFENVVMHIYGRYGWIVDQSAVEDKFNDWASAKLFMVADEVVARSDLYHLKNKLKGLVTGDNIRINPKNVAAHNESNHVNLVFMSNEAMPLVLDKDDRRYTVVWTPPKLAAEYYSDVGKEIEDGGVAAFHDYLLGLDLGQFNEHSKPLMTRAKDELVQLSKDSPDRFMEEWRDGDTRWDYHLCATADLFSCYKLWCNEQNERFSVAQNRFSNHIGKLDGITLRRVNAVRGGGERKTVRVVDIDAQEMPLGESLVGWRGKAIARFAANVSGGGDI